MANEDTNKVINKRVLKQRAKVAYYFIRPLVFIITFAVAAILINRYFLDAGSINHELIIQYCHVLQWPTVIALIYFLLRPYLPDMIPRIKKIWGIELENELPIQPDFGEKLANETTTTTAIDITTATGRASAIETDANIRWLLERTYRVAYGTQISALGLLQQVAEDMSIQELKFLYDRHVQLSSTPHPTIQVWLKFLTTNGLATLSGETIQITDIGRLFLEYLGKEGIGDPDYKQY